MMGFLFGLYLLFSGILIVVSSAMFIIACINIFKDGSK